MKSFLRRVTALALAIALALPVADVAVADENYVKVPNFRSKDMDGDPVVLEEIYISALLHGTGIPLFVQFYPRDYEIVPNDIPESDAVFEIDRIVASSP